MSRFDQLDHLLNYFEPSDLLDALTRAMSDSEFNENYQFIKRMHEIPDLEE
jgi:hypothetical protein